MPPQRTPGATPGDFGRTLREARERRGISLREIASATKISVAALEALERNDISRLPGGIFSRAFVRSYAMEVGLDPETTIQEFIAQFPHDSVTAGHPTSTQVEDYDAVESDRRMASAFLRLTLISVPIAIAVIYFGTRGRYPRAAPIAERAAEASRSTEAPRSIEASRATEASRPASTVEREPADERPVPVAAPPPSDPAPPRAADQLKVGLSVSRPCWVSATVDGEKKLERLLQPGDDQTLDVARELVLTAGDAGAVAWTLNGAPARPLGEAGKVVTTRVNLDNYKDLLQPR